MGAEGGGGSMENGFYDKVIYLFFILKCLQSVNAAANIMITVGPYILVRRNQLDGFLTKKLRSP